MYLDDLSLTSQRIIQEAEGRGIVVKRSGRRLSFLHRSGEHRVMGKKVPASFNSLAARKLVDQKEMTSPFLLQAGFLAPKNRVFLREDLEAAWAWAKPLLPVVVKPCCSKKGAGVFVAIRDRHRFVVAFKAVVEKYSTVLVEEFIPGDEYRFTLFNAVVVAVARKTPPHVVGDGEATIDQLIQKKNRARHRRSIPASMDILVDESLEEYISLQGYILQSIPSKGAVVSLRPYANISTGGEAHDVTDIMAEEIKETVEKAALSIPGLVVCGIDVIMDEDSSTPYILEINANPGFVTHQYPLTGPGRNVASLFVEAVFPGAKSPSSLYLLWKELEWALFSVKGRLHRIKGLMPTSLSRIRSRN